MRPAVLRWFRALLTVATAFVLAASGARADDARRPVDDDWPVQSTGPLAVDAGLVLALPATWQTGLSSGIGAGVTRGRRFAWGVRGSWSTATESSLVWTVTHDDFRLRAVGAVQQPAGRGVFALRLGLGPTFVHEHRTRNQGARAGLTGSDLESRRWPRFPARISRLWSRCTSWGRWSLTLSGGPTAIVADGALHGRVDGASSARGGSREAARPQHALLSRVAAGRGVREARGIRRARAAAGLVQHRAATAISRRCAPAGVAGVHALQRRAGVGRAVADRAVLHPARRVAGGGRRDRRRLPRSVRLRSRRRVAVSVPIDVGVPTTLSLVQLPARGRHGRRHHGARRLRQPGRVTTIATTRGTLELATPHRAPSEQAGGAAAAEDDAPTRPTSSMARAS